MTYAISFCDCMELLDSPWEIEGDAEAVYIGSAFCDQYFVNIPPRLWNQAKQLANNYGLKVALVLPIAGPQISAQLQELTATLINEGWINETVVNDYAMYNWVCKKWPKMKVWLGRLLSKDIRDPRYSLKPQAIKLYEKARYSEMLCTVPYGVEADLTEMPCYINQSSVCMLSIHVPLVYLSTGRICEFASIGLDLEYKFRPGGRCNRQCIRHRIQYEHHGVNYYKIGRAIYTDQCVPLEALEPLPVRLICTMLFRREQNEDTHACK